MLAKLLIARGADAELERLRLGIGARALDARPRRSAEPIEAERGDAPIGGRVALMLVEAAHASARDADPILIRRDARAFTAHVARVERGGEPQPVMTPAQQGLLRAQRQHF